MDLLMARRMPLNFTSSYSGPAATAATGAAAGAADYLAAQTRLPRGAFRVCPVAAIPKTEAGKTCYARLNVDGLWDAAGKELENCGKIEPGAV